MLPASTTEKTVGFGALRERAALLENDEERPAAELADPVDTPNKEEELFDESQIPGFVVDDLLTGSLDLRMLSSLTVEASVGFGALKETDALLKRDEEEPAANTLENVDQLPRREPAFELCEDILAAPWIEEVVP